MRNKRVDILKAIGIIAVVWGHFSSFCAQWIYSFHMPLFFFVTGFLRYGKDSSPWGKFLRKKVKTTVVPYILFWTVSVIVFNNLVYLIKFGQFFPIGFNEIKGLFLGGHWLHDYSNNFGLWFLQMYFITSIVFEVIARYFNMKMKIIIFLFCVFMTVPFQNWLPGRPIFHINVLPASIAFMLIGYFINYVLEEKVWLNKIKDNGLIGGFLLILGWAIAALNNYGNISEIGSPLYMVGATLTILAFYILSKRLTGSKLLNRIGAQTIFIFGLHGLTLPIIQSLLTYLGVQDASMVAIATVALSIFICCAIAEIYILSKEYFENFYKNLMHLKNNTF